MDDSLSSTGKLPTYRDKEKSEGILWKEYKDYRCDLNEKVK